MPHIRPCMFPHDSILTVLQAVTLIYIYKPSTSHHVVAVPIQEHIHTLLWAVTLKGGGGGVVGWRGVELSMAWLVMEG